MLTDFVSRIDKFRQGPIGGRGGRIVPRTGVEVERLGSPAPEGSARVRALLDELRGGYVFLERLIIVRIDVHERHADIVAILVRTRLAPGHAGYGGEGG